MSPEKICRAYGVEFTRYDGNRHGTLIASGCGLMMGTMDAVPLRYCIDVDSLDVSARSVSSVILLLARYSPPLAIAGWFSITAPNALRAGILQAEQHGLADNIVCYSGGNTGFLSDKQFTSLSAFYQHVCARILQLNT